MGLGREIKKSGRRRSSVMQKQKEPLHRNSGFLPRLHEGVPQQEKVEICAILSYIPASLRQDCSRSVKEKSERFFHDDILSHLRIVNVNKLFAHRL